ncbi:zeta toxin family protein [Timonella sp. A28]|uniref:zeta toxin family protein n=1 Tax=Timonella sp. A28 TaxID=3442640 RepID=UPI003EBBD7B4
MTEKLTPQELRRIFEADVRPYIDGLRGGVSAQPPRFVSVGGQPGAGKGRILKDAHRSIPGSAPVNGDNLRRFHPDYARLMREDPLRMPEVTASASGPWVGMSNEYLRNQKISAIVETTLRDSTMLQREFQAFKDAGYETELRVVAVPLEVSRAGTVERYIEQVKDYGAGRWTPGAAHDVAAANVGNTVRDLVASGVVDRVVVQNREGTIFHDENVRDGGIARGEAAAAAVETARDVRTMTPQQAQVWIERTAEALDARGKLGQNDPDLVTVCNRLATVDAAAVVPHAYSDEMN